MNAAARIQTRVVAEPVIAERVWRAREFSYGWRLEAPFDHVPWPAGHVRDGEIYAAAPGVDPRMLLEVWRAWPGIYVVGRIRLWPVWIVADPYNSLCGTNADIVALDDVVLRDVTARTRAQALEIFERVAAALVELRAFYCSAAHGSLRGTP